jgi:hypothetical protein
MEVVMKTLIVFIMLGSIAWQSDREFINRIDNYQIVLSAGWQAVPYTDAVGRQKTEFVYHQRSEGLLRITRESLTGTLSDRVRNDQNEMSLRFACLFSSKEAFSGGHLAGVRVALYYFLDNQRVIATYYYLQDGDHVWVLRFTGHPTSAGITHELTDKMARSFCSVCPTP